MMERIIWWAANPENSSNPASNRAHRANLAEHADLLNDPGWHPRVPPR